MKIKLKVINQPTPTQFSVVHIEIVTLPWWRECTVCKRNTAMGIDIVFVDGERSAVPIILDITGVKEGLAVCFACYDFWYAQVVKVLTESGQIEILPD